MKYSDNDINIAIQWDIATWSQALVFWGNQQTIIKLVSRGKGLEIGTNNGGLSYFFSKNFNSLMYCSDYGYPKKSAIDLHEKHGLSDKITYHDIDATEICFDSNYFDFVIFKSVLGIIGSQSQYSQQVKAMNEILRVLKPGGIVLFAENARGSLLHRLARKYFIPWGLSWRYVSYSEMTDLLKCFSSYELHSKGFLAAFSRNEGMLKKTLVVIDHFLDKILLNRWKYVIYGYATK